MKLTNTIHALSLLSFSALVMISCDAGMHVAHFNIVKESIDTLDILPVDVQIKTIDFFKIQKTDPQLERIVKDDIAKQIQNVLGSKYNTVLVDSASITNKQLYTELEHIAYSLQNKKNPIANVVIPSAYHSILKNSRHNYSLLLIVRSQYCINFPDDSNLLWIDPLTNTYITQSLFLIDNRSGVILHCKTTKTVGDISIKKSVEQITLESLRNVYYK